MPAASPPRPGLSNLRISTRVFAGFLSVLALLAAMGVAGVLGFERARGHVSVYGEVTGTAIAAMVAATGAGDAIIDALLRVTGRRLTSGGQAVRDAAMGDLGRLQAESRKTMRGLQLFLIVLAVIGELAGLGLAWVIARSIIRPLRRITGTMEGLAAGDRAVAIPALDARDEIGAMARAVQVFKDNAIAIERIRTGQERAKRAAERERGALMAELADGFRTSVQGVVEAVSASAVELHSAAAGMAGAAEDATRRLGTVSATSESTALNVRKVAASGTSSLSSDNATLSVAVGETGSAAGRVLHAADDLSVQSDRLRREVERFLGQIRADDLRADDVSWRGGAGAA